jgi:hypothetical protein
VAQESNAVGADPRELRFQIEQTRAEMTQTIDAIQERLSPSRRARRVLDAARENPIPFALAGAAVTVLLARVVMRSRKSRRLVRRRLRVSPGL